MSTRATHRALRAEDGANKPLFRHPAPEGRRMIWRDLQPLLLRSAGVVGLAGVIVAVVASAPVSDKPGPEARPAASQSLRGDAAKASTIPAIENEPAPAEADQRAAAIRELNEGPESGPPEVVAATTAREESEPAVAARAVAPGHTERTATAAVPTSSPRPATSPEAPSPATPSETATAKVAIRAALAPDAPVGAAAEQPPSIWADEASGCPRDWLTSQTPEGSGEDASECGAAALASAGGAARALEVAPPPPETVAALAGQPPELTNEALNLAPAALEAEALGTEGATNDLVAPIPRARPDPPKATVKKAKRTRTASSSKLGPPPNCGKKYARWRYVNKKPTWYCK